MFQLFCVYTNSHSEDNCFTNFNNTVILGFTNYELFISVIKFLLNGQIIWKSYHSWIFSVSINNIHLPSRLCCFCAKKARLKLFITAVRLYLAKGRSLKTKILWLWRKWFLAITPKMFDQKDSMIAINRQFYLLINRRLYNHRTNMKPLLCCINRSNKKKNTLNSRDVRN